MDLKIVSAVAKALTANGSNGYVRVAAQNPTVDATLMFHEIH